jgi:hypothetical protein
VFVAVLKRFYHCLSAKDYRFKVIPSIIAMVPIAAVIVFVFVICSVRVIVSDPIKWVIGKVVS